MQWGTASTLGSALYSGYYPQVAMDPSGNAMAAWFQNSGSDIYARRYSASSSSWGTVTVIDSSIYAAGSSQVAQVAMDSSGNAMAVWYQYNGSYWDIYASRYSATTSSWGTATVIDSGIYSAEYPQVAMSSSGCAVAVWFQHNGSPFQVYANPYQ